MQEWVVLRARNANQITSDNLSSLLDNGCVPASVRQRDAPTGSVYKRSGAVTPSQLFGNPPNGREICLVADSGADI